MKHPRPAIPGSESNRKGRAYLDLLRRINEITDKLIAALHDPELEGLEANLDAREVLCTELKRYYPMLDNLPASADEDGERSLLAEIMDAHGVLLRKQQECEGLLATRMRETKTSLVETSRRRGLRHAYKPDKSPRAAKFLDRKL